LTSLSLMSRKSGSVFCCSLLQITTIFLYKFVEAVCNFITSIRGLSRGRLLRKDRINTILLNIRELLQYNTKLLQIFNTSLLLGDIITLFDYICINKFT
jgi:hypothetical protein